MSAGPPGSTPPVIAIGGSAGALEALLTLLPALPPDLGAAVLVVIHMPPDHPSRLAEVLGRAGPLPAEPAQDGLPICAGHIYTAVPDHHLLLTQGCLRVTHGPRENRARPSIDVLFRSVALNSGPGALGLLLSGLLDDGVAGLWALGQLGGRVAVQHPEDAPYPSLPLNALREVEVHDILHTAQIGPALARWAHSRPPAAEVRMNDAERRRLELERDVAAGQSAFEAGLLNQGTLTPFTCPECHGVLVRFSEGGTLRFRCHTGHAYALESLRADLREATESSLWQATRVLEEQVMLLEHLGAHLDSAGQAGQAAGLRDEARTVGERARQLRALATRGPGLST